MAKQVPWTPGLASLHPAPQLHSHVQSPEAWWEMGGMQKGGNHLASYMNSVGSLETGNRKPEKGPRRPETEGTPSRPEKT